VTLVRTIITGRLFGQHVGSHTLVTCVELATVIRCARSTLCRASIAGAVVAVRVLHVAESFQARALVTSSLAAAGLAVVSASVTAPCGGVTDVTVEALT